MYTIRIIGSIAGKDIDLTVRSTANGHQVGMFVADFYEELMDQAPSLIQKFTSMMPGFAKLLNKFFSAVSK